MASRKNKCLSKTIFHQEAHGKIILGRKLRLPSACNLALQLYFNTWLKVFMKHFYNRFSRFHSKIPKNPLHRGFLTPTCVCSPSTNPAKRTKSSSFYSFRNKAPRRELTPPTRWVTGPQQGVHSTVLSPPFCPLANGTLVKQTAALLVAAQTSAAATFSPLMSEEVKTRPQPITTPQVFYGIPFLI